ncbi:hypothetical protein PhCBS80983_g05650 [Powellomyces hirtus]|uniref:Hemerythrin-like domain-containing protein n=1 Tax=Powellomyces hirtus TaxID=109895 RepID=A0A507DUS2_9FUNG|nr:hypothetical protein PhCBS80983_g05650 [Powellomyces hirtus]
MFTKSLLRLSTRTTTSAVARPILLQLPLQQRQSLATAAMSGIIQSVLQDHKEIDAYYQKYKQNAGNYDEQKKWANQLIWEVARHSAAEELVLYPAIEDKLSDGKALADAARAQHQDVKNDLYKLDQMSLKSASDSGAFDTQLRKVMDDLTRHIREEEEVDLPKLKAAISSTESTKMAQEFERTKLLVPTRPHPSAPDKPPFETVAGLMAAPLDKLRDVFRSFPSKEEVRKAEE